MDRTPVTAACCAASDAIARTSLAINQFVREVREARPEFDGISAELHSLDGVLDLLGYDAAHIPFAIAVSTPTVLGTCVTLITELEGCVSLLNQADGGRAEKKSRWQASRGHIEKLRWTLSEYKLVLGLATDFVGVMKAQTSEQGDRGLLDEHQLDPPSGVDVDDNELAVVSSQIHQAARDLERGRQQSVALARLGQYLGILQAEAQMSSPPPKPQSFRRPHRSSSMGGPPDSAIDVSYDDRDDRESAFLSLSKLEIPPSSASINSAEDTRAADLDDFVGELNEMPIATPPLPARSASRMSSRTGGSRRRPSAVDGQSPRVTSPTSPSWQYPASTSPFAWDSRGSGPHDRYFTPVTELPEPSEDSGSSVSAPSLSSRSHSRRSSIIGQTLHSIWEHPRADVPTPTSRPTTASGRDTPQIDQANLLRRGSSKLTTTFRGFGFKRSALNTVADEAKSDATGVFGTPLAKSIQVAKGIASARHGSGEGSSRGTREYPLSVLRCVYYIRDCGVQTPRLFGLEGDSARVEQLKSIFSAPSTSYGKDLDWAHFTVHDAADLILLFLTELPQPVVSESVAKRWISMSRQATIRSARLDQGLDFWEEAMMGIRGPGRSLFKLLLGLWGDVAEAASTNEMTAERIAARVVKPLMHAESSRRYTDYLLGLSFLIRKRAEYNIAANGLTRKSNAAF
ncbi:hypothetical protein B0J18DRAFT_23 [Chaetomium sp. MPI-SDFR-AT-0129]|nr:hypothetical protein B0J18DRAFT_23 [Chaetomium sp. MPI-SDFR-AT-0129]